MLLVVCRQALQASRSQRQRPWQTLQHSFLLEHSSCIFVNIIPGAQHLKQL